MSWPRVPETFSKVRTAWSVVSGAASSSYQAWLGSRRAPEVAGISSTSGDPDRGGPSTVLKVAPCLAALCCAMACEWLERACPVRRGARADTNSPSGTTA